MLRYQKYKYRLEFINYSETKEINNPSADNSEWETTCKNMVTAGFKISKSINPYWDNSGKTFKDPEEYRVVLQNKPWDLLS